MSVVAAILLAFSTNAFAGATIVIINDDDPGEGFNDPTAAVPVGGNSGTTLGAQRLIAFQHAANIWGATLDSNQTIVVSAAFNPLAPNVLGSAGAKSIFANFGQTGLYPGPEFPDTWYGSALADKRAGADLDSTIPDIVAQFSSNFNFYLGLDNNHGPLNDLVTVLLHELGHGLNFQNFVAETDGTQPDGLTDIYARHTFDTVTGKFWNQMTDAERAASALRYGAVVWDGSSVTHDLPDVLVLGNPEVRILPPSPIAGLYQFGTAAFGPPISASTIMGEIVASVDAANGAGPTTTDGCTAFTNAAAIAGHIALIERGTCGFVVKAKNAQNAGATAVIIANNFANAANPPPGMAGIDDTITIPSVSITYADGIAVRGNLPATASFSVDPLVRAGADPLGRARLYMPRPVAAGSSGSHYDSIASRNLLMEPAINPDLTHNLKAPDDLTLELLRDVGWFKDTDLDGIADQDDCSAASDLSATIVIDGKNTGVPNTMFSNGCTISDLIHKIGSDAGNHGEFASGVSHLTNELRNTGVINAEQKAAIQRAAAGASVPAN